MYKDMEKGSIKMNTTMMILVQQKMTKILVVSHTMTLCHKKKQVSLENLSTLLSSIIVCKFLRNKTYPNILMTSFKIS